MSHYSPDSEPKSERLFLLSVEGSCGYGHIKAQVVRRAIPDQVNPDTGHITYNDGTIDAYGIRSATWSSSKKSGLFVEGLTVQNQFDTDTNNPAYGWSTRFMNVYSVELNDAKKLLRTLEAVEKKLEKIRTQFGYADTYSDYLVRVANAIGIKKFIIARKSCTSFISHDYFEVKPDGVRYEVTKLEDSIRTIKKDVL